MFHEACILYVGQETLFALSGFYIVKHFLDLYISFYCSNVFYTFRSLTRLAEDFQNISESCLLVLHLEIRCHCFYYLMRTVQDVCSLMLVIEILLVNLVYFFKH